MSKCPYCHDTVEMEAAFCGACGNRLSTEDGASAVPADPLIGLVIDERYRIIDLIGRGGMGAVYRVEHLKMGKIMAMKLLHGELSQDMDVARRFEREAHAVSRLSHVNNVSVFDFGSHQGMMYLVMEYIDGLDLSEVLRTEGVLPLGRVLNIMVQVCSGLIDAHNKGIIHRDLKPENIIVYQSQDQPEFVKVVDFGLAKLRSGKVGTNITQQGSLVGTPYYMAPEHIREEGVDARTDVYALGAVMHKLLSGETPFTASTPMGIITKHLTEDVAPPSIKFPDLEIPPLADDIILKAMAKAPGDRYSSALEMRRALADLAAQIDPGSVASRFTAAREGSVWQMGDQGARDHDPSRWNMGETPVMTQLPVTAGEKPLMPTGPVKAHPSTVQIGAVEMPVGTKSDVIKFEKSIRRKRVWTVILLSLLGLGILAGGAYLFLVYGRDNSIPTAETEPNDTIATADTLIPGIQLSGYIVADGSNADVDWYRLNGPPKGAWALEVQISGVPSADIALQIIEPDGSDPLAEANREGAGGLEEIHPIVIDKPTVFLAVQEVRRPGVPPGTFNTQPYGLLYRMYDSSTVEREPNDTMSTATAARIGTPIQGRLDSDVDADWYCLPAGQQTSMVQVSGTIGVDIVLGLVTGENAREVVINNAVTGQGEVISLTPGPGPVCVAVRRIPPTGDGDSSSGYPYQILFQ